MTAAAVTLPPLRLNESPNHSSRRGVVPYLVVVHRPAGSFESAEYALTDDTRPPADRVSAHALLGTGHRAVQLVRWDEKAWACAAFNSASYNVEVGDQAWTGGAPELLAEAARAVAFLCARTGIPPIWSTNPTHAPGIVRHYDLGRAGGGHTDPTTDARRFGGFMAQVLHEHKRGDFRATWGAGELHRIDT